MEDIGKHINDVDDDAILEEDELDDSTKENETQHDEKDEIVRNLSKIFQRRQGLTLKNNLRKMKLW